MGLDMYLKARAYVGGWRSNKDPMFSRLVEISGITPHADCPSFDLSVSIGYWRKANAIHAWFVKNVQGGKDECQISYVSREQLTSLRDDCKKVLDSVETVEGRVSQGSTIHPGGEVEEHFKDGPVVAQKGIAASILPTQDGFFFGGTDYDEYYLRDLRDTIEIIDKALALPKNWEFQYQSSW